MQVLLEMDCIPSGMEYFPATDKDQVSLIKVVIDDRDYLDSDHSRRFRVNGL